MKNKKTPMRKCVGCNESKPKKELIRIACYEGNITVDITGRAKGRGVYVCKNENCLKNAIKRKAFNRAFGMDIDDMQKGILIEEIKKYEEDK